MMEDWKYGAIEINVTMIAITTQAARRGKNAM